MVKNLFVILALAAGLFVVTQGSDAEARWRCGPAACFWTPGYVGVVPGYAAAWAPPHRAGCFWKLNRRGKWKYKC